MYTIKLMYLKKIKIDEFDQKFKSYNVEYKKKDALIVEQKKLIDERNKNIKSLQERIRTLERKLETELETRDQLIKKLTLQVDTQSNQIASLTFQLHHNNNKATTTMTTATTTTIINKKFNSNHDLNLTAASSNTSSKDYINFSNAVATDAPNNRNNLILYPFQPRDLLLNTQYKKIGLIRILNRGNHGN